MAHPWRRRLLAYAAAAVCPLVSLAIRLGVHPSLPEQRALFISFMPAVAAAAFLGGWWPGLLATVISMVLIEVFLIPPFGSFAIENPSEFFGLGFFFFVGAFMSYLSELLRRTRDRAVEAEAFRQANDRLELAVRGSNVSVWDSERPTGDISRDRIQFVNLWEQLGFEVPPRDTDNVLEFIHPDDRSRLQETTRRYLANEVPTFEIEFRLRHIDGNYRTMLARGTVLRDASNIAVRFTGIAMDITRLKHFEESLAHEKFLLHTMMDNLPDGIYFKDSV